MFRAAAGDYQKKARCNPDGINFSFSLNYFRIFVHFSRSTLARDNPFAMKNSLGCPFFASPFGSFSLWRALEFSRKMLCASREEEKKRLKRGERGTKRSKKLRGDVSAFRNRNHEIGMFSFVN
jgi:hypothetical protein